MFRLVPYCSSDAWSGNVSQVESGGWYGLNTLKEAGSQRIYIQRVILAKKA